MNVNITTLGMAIGIILARRVHIQVDNAVVKYLSGQSFSLCIPSIARLLGQGDGYYKLTLADLLFIGVIFALYLVARKFPVLMPVVVAFVIYMTMFEIHEFVFGTLFIKENEPIAPEG